LSRLSAKPVVCFKLKLNMHFKIRQDWMAVLLKDCSLASVPAERNMSYELGVE
jgi:hypothetical protein